MSSAPCSRGLERRADHFEASSRRRQHAGRKSWKAEHDCDHQACDQHEVDQDRCDVLYVDAAGVDVAGAEEQHCEEQGARDGDVRKHRAGRDRGREVDVLELEIPDLYGGSSDAGHRKGRNDAANSASTDRRKRRRFDTDPTRASE